VLPFPLLSDWKRGQGLPIRDAKTGSLSQKANRLPYYQAICFLLGNNAPEEKRRQGTRQMALKILLFVFSSSFRILINFLPLTLIGL
jgi:hypothetical protein